MVKVQRKLLRMVWQTKDFWTWLVLSLYGAINAGSGYIPQAIMISWYLDGVLLLLTQSHFSHNIPIFHFNNRGFHKTSSGGYYSGRFPVAPFIDAEWSLSISSRADLGTSFSYKITNPLDYGKFYGKRVHQQCQIQYFESVAVIAIHTKIQNGENKRFTVFYTCKATVNTEKKK